MSLVLPKYSLGVGDRFARQARPQLAACRKALEEGVAVSPVWNKSNREHKIVGSEPSSVRTAADEAVRESGWTLPYFVDADHINVDTVDRFIGASDFFTLDVADAIGKPAGPSEVDAFLKRHPELNNGPAAAATASKYLFAVSEARRIYAKIENAKGAGNFVTEVSMDETDCPQSPPELLLILAAIADEKIPIQTIAPKFTGRFNKGVDYVGDVAQFEKEFSEDLAVIDQAVESYGLPATLKLSVHSGSDKFSIYGAIKRSLKKTSRGVHVKTAGTTWLEELIGLAEAGPEGLAMAKQVYRGAYEHVEDLCAPYSSVIDIDPARLPTPVQVESWRSEEYAGALRHDPANKLFNPHLRQLLHVGYKIAAGFGDRYIEMLDHCEGSISRNVSENLYARHIRPLFV